MNRFHQQMDIFSQSDALAEDVHIIGAGAIGSFTALALAKMGVENITVYDHDTIELHNVDNQLYGPAYLGQRKCSALQSIVRQLSGVQIRTHAIRVEGVPDTMGAHSTLVLATDSIDSRRHIWDACRYEQYRCHLDARMGAQVLFVQTVNPGNLDDHAWYEESFFDASERVAARCTEKSIMYTPFIAGGLIASQLKRYWKNESYRKQLTMLIPQCQLIGVDAPVLEKEAA